MQKEHIEHRGQDGPMEEPPSYGQQIEGDGYLILNTPPHTIDLDIMTDDFFIVLQKGPSTGTYSIDGQEEIPYIQRPGVPLMCGPGIQFRCKAQSSQGVIVLHFNEEFLPLKAESKGVDVSGNVLATMRFDSHVARLQQLMMEALEEGQSLYLEKLATALAARCLILCNNEESADTVPDSSEDIIQGITSYMEENLSEPIRLEELSHVANMSPFHFLRSFKKHVGVTPHQYLLQLRVEETRKLLKTTELSIAHIAHDLGFSSQSHLARVFKRATGMTPSQFRTNI